MPHWLFLVLQLRRRLWVTAGLYSLLGVAAALLAAWFGPYVPADFPFKLGSDAVDDILSILASSMLAVATFSLAALVNAYTSVIASVAPRAAPLLVSDSKIRNPLATFVGAFIYAVVGIVAVHTGYYGAQGRVILFFVTLLVLLLVIAAMLRWIGHLSDLGQSARVIARVAEVTAKALVSDSIRASAFAAPPPRSLRLHAEAPGFVQNVDVAGLQRLAAQHQLRIHVTAVPGVFVHGGQPIMHLSPGPLSSALASELRGCISTGSERTFEQDPLYGLRVLGEIAARALSPGVNDLGTAREVMYRTVIMLTGRAPHTEGPKVASTAVTLAPISATRMLHEALGPVARYGGSDLGLQLELQEACLALAASGDPELSAAGRTLSRWARMRNATLVGGAGAANQLRRAARAVSEGGYELLGGATVDSEAV